MVESLENSTGSYANMEVVPDIKAFFFFKRHHVQPGSLRAFILLSSVSIFTHYLSRMLPFPLTQKKRQLLFFLNCSDYFAPAQITTAHDHLVDICTEWASSSPRVLAGVSKWHWLYQLIPRYSASDLAGFRGLTRTNSGSWGVRDLASQRIQCSDK